MHQVTRVELERNNAVMGALDATLWAKRRGASDEARQSVVAAGALDLED